MTKDLSSLSLLPKGINRQSYLAESGMITTSKDLDEDLEPPQFFHYV